MTSPDQPSILDYCWSFPKTLRPNYELHKSCTGRKLYHKIPFLFVSVKVSKLVQKLTGNEGMANMAKTMTDNVGLSDVFKKFAQTDIGKKLEEAAADGDVYNMMMSIAQNEEVRRRGGFFIHLCTLGSRGSAKTRVIF